MDEKKHSKFTDSKAVVSRKVGGKFSVFGGWLFGKNLEIAKGKKIVQEWHAEMDEWPKGHFSKAFFYFKKEKGGTKLSFVHSGVPKACAKEISIGWKEHYWQPMKKMLEK